MSHKDFIKTIGLPVAAAVITTLVMGGGFFLWARHNQALLAFLVSPASSAGITATSTVFLYPFESVVVNAVKKANPAVVAITITKNVPVYEQYYRNVPDPFGDFFGGGSGGDFFNFNIPELRQNGTKKQDVGGGSGFLVSSDGYIVTNRHVVEDAVAEYTVFTNDGKKYSAKVVARDPALDLAVIKIKGSGFPYLPFGNSDTLQVGESVIAIGNALAQYRNTVSTGIVSGLSRSIVANDGAGGAESLDQLIQTDAAINPGNSGGPLLNLSGEVIGVNVAIASGAENIGFAISGNGVKSVVESVKRTGKIVRPYLGIRYVPITDAVKEKNHLSFSYGILVERGAGDGELAVIPGSPADKAGIVENDIILEVDGVKITNDKNLAAIIRTKNVGDTVRLKLFHKGQEKIVTVTLEEMK